MKGLREFKKSLRIKGKKFFYFSISDFSKKFNFDISKLPFSLRVLLENLLRNYDGKEINEEILSYFSKYDGKKRFEKEFPFYPSRVLLQDFTGVPLVVDLAAMRNKMKEMGKDPKRINPYIPSHLIIDHSVQVDFFATEYSFNKNLEKEYERNSERYVLLKWAQNSLKNFKIFPPASGIIHQVNLEYIGEVISKRKIDGENFLFPDTVIGTDSHTTMINGIGVLGWGVGGIEAEAVMLGEPIYLIFPEVIGVKLKGKLKEGITSTDLVLYVTKKLREKKVVGKFVEYFGEGLKNLSVFDRAVVSNMAPEYGSTCGFFPIDEKVLEYLEFTGRNREIVERYLKENSLFYDYSYEPVYSEIVEIDLDEIKTCVSGPSRPHDMIYLNEVKDKINSFIIEKRKDEIKGAKISSDEVQYEIKDGSVVIAAITSCTNTSNPYLLIGAGILAKKAVNFGLKTKPYVKTSFAPGSIFVKNYMEKSGLLPYLEALGFHIVGFGCTTCIGNSGPLPPQIEKVIKENDLIVSSCISGNRNFEARIHPLVKMNFLMSPPLVVAFAIKGNILWNPYEEPIGFDPNGNPVYLKDIWPSSSEIEEYLKKFISKKEFKKSYSKIFEGDENWKKLKAPKGDIFEFDPSSTYIKEPPFFKDFKGEEIGINDIKNARCLALLGDSITTDHISPAGKIHEDSPAGKYLISLGVKPSDFNTFGARRGNHEVMIRGTFGNIRLKNKLVDKEGGFTVKFPENIVMTIYDAAMKYKEENVPLLIIAGKEYGSGSSRDWAAKGTSLLGIKAVIAESFERIHRSNLVQLGVLPLQFLEGENAEKIGIKGDEIFDIEGLEENVYPLKKLKVKAKRNGEEKVFEVILRLDTYMEIEYMKFGGILPYVLSKFLKKK
jgi:aconitate hydratase